jgi:hypothetical protein
LEEWSAEFEDMGRRYAFWPPLVSPRIEGEGRRLRNHLYDFGEWK